MASPRTRARPSARTTRISDPLAPQAGSMPFGGMATARPQNVVERGTVLAVDAQQQMYRVHLNSGRTMLMARIRSHPGDMVVLPVGVFVMVSFALGMPYIIGVLPPETAVVNEENVTSITDVEGHGGNDPLLGRSLGVTSRGPNEPRDVVPGDFVGTGPDGASVSALHGKVAQLRASPLAKVQAFGDNDLVQIVAGVLRTVTWMGESKVVNDEGKTSFQWRGGTDQLTQTGGDEERYTIKLDVGHTGNMIKLEVCNRDHQTVFRFHVSPEGQVELYAAGGFNQHSGDNDAAVHPVNYHGSVAEVVTGGASRQVSGDVTETHEGNRTETVSGNHALTIGQDKVLNVSRDQNVNVGGNATQAVTGNLTTNILGDCKTTVFTPGKVHSVKTTGGDVTVETQLGAYSVATSGGTVGIDAGVGQARVTASVIELLASTGSISLGAPSGNISIGNGAASGSVRWEQLNVVLQTLVAEINAKLALIAAHAHPPPTGPAAPSPTLVPVASPLILNMLEARSPVRIG